MGRLVFGAAMIALLVSGCAPSLEAFNERGGVIRHTQAGTNMSGVLALANQYCHEHGRVAQITSTEIVFSDTVTFNCVDP